jgi:hypothetical protein
METVCFSEMPISLYLSEETEWKILVSKIIMTFQSVTAFHLREIISILTPEI